MDLAGRRFHLYQNFIWLYFLNFYFLKYKIFHSTDFNRFQLSLFFVLSINDIVNKKLGSKDDSFINDSLPFIKFYWQFIRIGYKSKTFIGELIHANRLHVYLMFFKMLYNRFQFINFKRQVTQPCCFRRRNSFGRIGK